MTQHISSSLPPSQSGIAQLQAAIAMLEKENVDDTKFKLLAEIANSIFYSEESEQRFIKCGFAAAIELYDAATMNSSYEETQNDPENPRNWESYDNRQDELDKAIETLTLEILNYRSDTFHARGCGVTRQIARDMAAWLIHSKLFNEDGTPQEVDGEILMYAFEMVGGETD